MIAWINLIVMIIATKLYLYLYVLSVQPVAMERKIGERAWARCKYYRAVAIVFEVVIVVNYVLYIFFPLPIALSHTFPWPWWVSLIIAVVIGVPSVWIMWIGLRDAGPEAVAPKKEHALYGGIYEKMRHPQSVGEMPIFWSIAFLLHSPFLVLWTFIYVPIYVVMCWAEERDLLLRFGEAYASYRRRVGIFRPKKS